MNFKPHLLEIKRRLYMDDNLIYMNDWQSGKMRKRYLISFLSSIISYAEKIDVFT